MKNYNRIFITGNAGAGKTTLAKYVSNILNLKFDSLDSIVWQSNWQVTSLDERQQLIAKLLNKNEWIIEGVSADVLVNANIIIFLDIPRFLCYIRLIKRNYKFLFRSRPELPDNCPEFKIIFRLIKIVWKFNAVVRPVIINHINNVTLPKNTIIYHIKNKKDLVKLYTHFSSFCENETRTPCTNGT
jgi:adenylate kinase family enzyme